MKVEIKVEQFDNGISLQWKDTEGVADPQNVVAVERDQTKVIGQFIWDDIRNVMDAELANVVVLSIDYKIIR